MTDDIDPPVPWGVQFVDGYIEIVNAVLAPENWYILVLVVVALMLCRAFLPTVEGVVYRPRMWRGPVAPKSEDAWFGVNVLSKPIAALTLLTVADNVLVGVAAVALMVSFIFHDLPAAFRLPDRPVPDDQ